MSRVQCERLLERAPGGRESSLALGGDQAQPKCAFASPGDNWTTFLKIRLGLGRPLALGIGAPPIDERTKVARLMRQGPIERGHGAVVVIQSSGRCPG